jgi:hypothetical protein
MTELPLELGKEKCDACDKPTSILFPLKILDDTAGEWVYVLWCSYCVERMGEHEWDFKAQGR